MAGLRSQLENMGADLVLTEEEMRATKVADPLLASFPDSTENMNMSHAVPGVEVG